MSRSRSRRFLHAELSETLESRVLLSASRGGGNKEVRSFDGSGNNQQNSEWGAAHTQLLRLTTVEYGAGMSGIFPAMAPRLDSQGNTINPRTVSNLVFDQDESVLNDRGLTSFVFQWGQFLDHDMDLTEAFPPAPMRPTGEDISFFVPNDGTETELPPGTIIPMLRSHFELDGNGVAQQINLVTSYIDGSNVYGSSVERADALRSHYGGFMLTSDGETNLTDGSGEFLPFNYMINGQYVPNASPPTTGTGVPLNPEDLFIAGDVRVNEQPGLATMHTLFVREHNYQARRLAEQLGLDQSDLADPDVDERLFQMARAIVIAEIQSITYNEFLPALMGPTELETYRGYQDDVNASIANIFSASLYRVGHTMLPNELLVLQADGTPVPDDSNVLGAEVIDGQVSLGDAFFNPALITQFGIESYLVGLQNQQIQEIDNMIVDGVRNLLFDPPAGTDLGATNLQRSRDHGLPDYNQARIDFGLAPRTTFSEITSNPDVAQALQTAYDGNINNIDVFAAAISEDRIPGGSLGELIHTVLADQFTRLRDGDRFYYENVFKGKQLAEIKNTQLSDIIRRNSDLPDVPDEAFRNETVLTYRVQEVATDRDGRGGKRDRDRRGDSDDGATLTLRVRNGRLEIVDEGGRRDRIVASQAISTTSIVAIHGASKNDRFQIDSSVAEHFDGSVEIYGGGGKDDLDIDVNRRHDVERAPTAVHVEDMSIYYGNTEDVDVKRIGGRKDSGFVGGSRGR